MPSVRGCQMLPLSPPEMTPAGSKMDLLLAEPIRDQQRCCDSTFKKGNEVIVARRERSEIMQEKQECSVDTKVSEERMEKVLQVPEHRFPLQPVVKKTNEAGCPLKPVREQRSMCSLGRISHQSRWIPKEVVNLWEAHTGAGFLAGPVALQWTHTGAARSWRMASCGKDPELKKFVTAHKKEPHWKSSWKTFSCGRDMTLEHSKEFFLGGSRGKTTVWWTDHNAHSLSSCPGERSYGIRNKDKSWKKRMGWEKVFLRFACISHYPTLM